MRKKWIAFAMALVMTGSQMLGSGISLAAAEVAATEDSATESVAEASANEGTENPEAALQENAGSAEAALQEGGETEPREGADDLNESAENPDAAVEESAGGEETVPQESTEWALGENDQNTEATVGESAEGGETAPQESTEPAFNENAENTEAPAGESNESGEADVQEGSESEDPASELIIDEEPGYLTEYGAGEDGLIQGTEEESELITEAALSLGAGEEDSWNEYEYGIFPETLVNDDESLCCPGVGETLALGSEGYSAGLYRWQGDAESKEPVKEGVQYILEYDENVWEETETDASGIPILLRKNTWDTWVTLIARLNTAGEGEDDSWTEVARMDYHFDELNYGAWLERSYGDDHYDRIYTGEPLELTLGMTDELAGAMEQSDHWSVKWILLEENNPEEEFTEDSCCVKYVLSEDGYKATLTLDEESWEANHGKGQRYVIVEARIMYKDTEITSAMSGGWLCETSWDYELPGDTVLLFGDGYFQQDKLGVWVYSKDSMDGAYEEVTITDLRTESYLWDGEAEETDGEKWVPSEKPLLSREEPQEGGWYLEAGYEPGMVQVTLTYQIWGSEEEEKFTYRLYVDGTRFSAHWEYPKAIDWLTYGESMEIPFELYQEDYNFEIEQTTGETVDFHLELETDQEGNPCWDTQVAEAEIQGGTLILTGVGEGSTAVPVNVYWDRDDGEPELVLTEWVIVNVSGGYYAIEPAYLTQEERNLKVGEDFTLTPVLVEYQVGENGETLRTELTDAYFQWSDLDGNVWSYEEEQVSGFTKAGEALPALIREMDGDMGALLRAYLPDEDGNLQEVTSVEYRFYDVDCSLEIQPSYGSREEMILYAGEENELTLTLDKELPDTYQGYKVDWLIRVDGEVLTEENNPDWLSVTSEGDTLSLAVREEGHAYAWIETEVILYGKNGAEIDRDYVGIQVRETALYIPGFEGGSAAFLVGSGLVADRVDENGQSQLYIFVEDKEHPGGEQVLADWIDTEIADEQVLELRTQEDGGRMVHAAGPGESEVAFTLSCPELWGEEVKTLSVTFHVSEEQYSLFLDSDTGGWTLLPDEALTLIPTLYHGWYDAENERTVWEEVPQEDYRVTYNADEEQQIVSVDENGTVLGLELGEAWIHAQAWMDTSSGQEDVVGENDTQIYVAAYYYAIQFPENQLFQVDAGETLELSPTVIRYGISNREGVEIDGADWILEPESQFVTSQGLALTVASDMEFEEGEEMAEVGLVIRARFTDYWEEEQETWLTFQVGQHRWVQTGHNDATCTLDGSDLWRCENEYCAYHVEDRVEIIPAKGHTVPSGWTVTKAATCTAGGTQVKKCTVCGEEIEKQTIPAKGHKAASSWTVTKAATCTASGTQVKKCAVCGTVIQSQTIPAKGHTVPSGWTVTKAATCTAGGTQVKKCAVCGTVIQSQTIPATGNHRWSAWKQTKAPTALAAGQEKRTCSVCGGAQTRAVAKLKAAMTVTSGSLTMKVKQKFTKFKVTGLQTGDSVASWKSSNTKVLKVSGKSNGTCTLTAQNKTGKATLTITLRSGLVKKVTVTVQKGTVKTKSIKNVAKSVTLQKGKTLALSPVLNPVTSQQKITYSSSNKKVATVSSTGKIKAVSPGTAKITVKSGSKKAVITVKVTGIPAKAITNVKAALTLKKGKSTTLKPKLSPASSTDKITYSSSNKKVATVSSKGKITAKKKGTAVITVKAGKVSFKCKVTVK